MREDRSQKGWVPPRTVVLHLAIDDPVLLIYIIVLHDDGTGQVVTPGGVQAAKELCITKAQALRLVDPKEEYTSSPTPRLRPLENVPGGVGMCWSGVPTLGPPQHGKITWHAAIASFATQQHITVQAMV